MTQFRFIMASVNYWDPSVKFPEIPFAHMNKFCNCKRYKMSLCAPGRHNVGCIVTCIDLVLDGGKWLTSGPICLSLWKALVSIFTSPGWPHTWFGLFHLGTYLLLMQRIELTFLGHPACSPAHIIPLLFKCRATTSMFLPARTLAA